MSMIYDRKAMDLSGVEPETSAFLAPEKIHFDKIFLERFCCKGSVLPAELQAQCKNYVILTYKFFLVS